MSGKIGALCDGIMCKERDTRYKRLYILFFGLLSFHIDGQSKRKLGFDVDRNLRKGRLSERIRGGEVYNV